MNPQGLRRTSTFAVDGSDSVGIPDDSGTFEHNQEIPSSALDIDIEEIPPTWERPEGLAARIKNRLVCVIEEGPKKGIVAFVAAKITWAILRPFLRSA